MIAAAPGASETVDDLERGPQEFAVLLDEFRESQSPCQRGRDDQVAQKSQNTSPRNA